MTEPTKTRIYIGGRGTGKTTLLVNWYRKTPNAKIVVTNEGRRNVLHRHFEVPLTDIITPEQINRQYFQGRSSVLGIDNLEDLFASLWMDFLSRMGHGTQVEHAVFDPTWFEHRFDTVYLTEEKTNGIHKEHARIEAERQHEKALRESRTAHPSAADHPTYHGWAETL